MSKTRLVLAHLGVAALLLSCLPTEPCACTPPRTLFLVFGSVVRAGGMPASEARIQLSAPFASGANCDAAGFREVMDPVVAAGVNGQFRSTVFSIDGAGPRCLRVTAFAGSPGSSDSTVVDRLIVQFRSGTQSDSLGIQLTLP